MNTGVLVIETNGLHPETSDILQVVLTGTPGYAAFFSPDKCSQWDLDINGLLPEALKDFPVFGKEEAEELGKILACYNKVLVYNEDFIYNFLTANGVPVLPGLFTDVMKLYSEKFQNESYEKRIKALADYNIKSSEAGAFSKALSIKELYDELTAKPKVRTEGRDGP